jgi:hypothetical protein
MSTAANWNNARNIRGRSTGRLRCPLHEQAGVTPPNEVRVLTRRHDVPTQVVFGACEGSSIGRGELPPCISKKARLIHPTASGAGGIRAPRPTRRSKARAINFSVARSPRCASDVGHEARGHDIAGCAAANGFATQRVSVLLSWLHLRMAAGREAVPLKDRWPMR